MSARRWWTALLTLGALMSAGCAGYHVGPVGNIDYRSVAVPMFRNKTLKPQLEAQITNAIIKRFQTDGTLRVENDGRADVILTGVIERYERDELRALRADAGVPREYNVRITARIEARRAGTGELVLKPRDVTGAADVFIGADEQASEYQALPLIADDLARRVVSLLTERW